MDLYLNNWGHINMKTRVWYSGAWRRVVRREPDFSEEHTASFFIIKETSRRWWQTERLLLLYPFFFLACSLNLKMEAICSSNESGGGVLQTTHCYVRGDGTIHRNRYENLKSNKTKLLRPKNDTGREKITSHVSRYTRV